MSTGTLSVVVVNFTRFRLEVHVQKEVHHAEQLCTLHGWRQVHVTGKSVEEVSREIMVLLPREDRAAHGMVR